MGGRGSKKYDMTPFLATKKFSYHWTLGVCQMVIEIFQSLKRACKRMIFFSKMKLHAPTPFSDWKISITIQHTPTVGWKLKVVKACAINFFFKNHPMLSLLGNQKFSIAIWWWGYVWWRPNVFGCHLKHLHYLMVTKFFGHPKRHGGKGMKWQ